MTFTKCEDCRVFRCPAFQANPKRKGCDYSDIISEFMEQIKASKKSPIRDFEEVFTEEEKVLLEAIRSRPNVDVLYELEAFTNNPDNTFDMGNAKKGIDLAVLYRWMQSKGWNPS